MVGQNRLASPLENATSVVITGATLIDVRTGEQIKDSVIVVDGDRIKQVGKAREVNIPPSAKIIDARGKWILPGLIELRSHVSQARSLPLQLYLANGVTTIRDPGGNLTLVRLMRERIDSGKLIGPRLFFAGPILDGNPPFWAAASIMVDTPERRKRSQFPH